MGDKLTILKKTKDLDGLWEASREMPVLLFKHSTRCPISTRALAEFDQARKADEAGRIRWVFLDLIAHRDCSDEIASRTGVPHASPQAILLKDGQAAWNASHSNITADALANFCSGQKRPP